MSGSSNEMRNYMKLMEAGYPRPGDENPMVSYNDVVAKSGKEKGEITKVIATLSSYESGKYTRLAQNITRMQEIATETLALEAQIKQDGRDAIAELFAAEDAAYTRVVDTVSFVMSLTKDPKPTTTYKYAEVLSELETHMTPQLIEILESIKDKFATVTQKQPALKYEPKAGGVGDKNESISEAPLMNKMKAFFKTYLDKIMSWGQKYDDKLAMLKQKAGIASESIAEAISSNSFTPDHVARMITGAIMNTPNERMSILHKAKGATLSVTTQDGSVFEINVKQIN